MKNKAKELLEKYEKDGKYPKMKRELLILFDIVGQSEQLKPLPPSECETCGVLIDPRLNSCGSCGF